MNEISALKLIKNKGLFEKMVSSGAGVFKTYSPANYIIGPRLTDSGQVQGDLLLSELNYFNEVASTEQKWFF